MTADTTGVQQHVPMYLKVCQADGPPDAGTLPDQTLLGSTPDLHRGQTAPSSCSKAKCRSHAGSN